MDGNLSLILAFLVSISVVLALVIKFKLHPFLSLFIGCLLANLLGLAVLLAASALL